MERLAPISALAVRQKKEWGEILTGFETKNKYSILDADGRTLYLAAEESGNILLRWFLTAYRPFTISILSEDGRLVMQIKRPFRFYFHEASIMDAQGQLLGTVKRQFSILRRIYSVISPSGQETHQLFGPILHPWTFHIKENDREVGKITKKWSGALKEVFTDADNFAMTFPLDWDIRRKAVFLGALFLIDFVHFESKNN